MAPTAPPRVANRFRDVHAAKAATVLHHADDALQRPSVGVDGTVDAAMAQ
jgi:hypothetical protein